MYKLPFKSDGKEYSREMKTTISGDKYLCHPLFSSFIIFGKTPVCIYKQPDNIKNSTDDSDVNE